MNVTYGDLGRLMLFAGLYLAPEKACSCRGNRQPLRVGKNIHKALGFTVNHFSSGTYFA